MNLVTNLSSKSLTSVQFDVLSRGLLFIPNPLGPMVPIEKDVNEFSRLLRLAYVFRDAPSALPHPFKPKSGYTPLSSGNEILEQFLGNLSYVVPVIGNVALPSTYNLSLAESRAIRELKKSDVIINKSDKGGEIVVSDAEHYIVEGLVHLADDETYTLLDDDPTSYTAGKVKQLADELFLSGFIDCHERNFITPPNPVKTPVFYHLWKTHKQSLAIRPIVSGCSGPTAGLSSFLDHFLKQGLDRVPAHIGNTDTFLRELHQLKLSGDVILVTADVKSLYTMIPQDEGIEALLEVCSDILPFPKHMTKSALNLVLKMNSFSFNGMMYHQKMGVAMGSPISPTLAIIFMHRLETKLLAQCKLTPVIYRRYIDDIFFVWTHGERTLLEFFSQLNSMHPSIKFTWEHSDKSVNFLDVTIFKPRNFEGTLAFKPYSKPTSKHLYVHALSHHPTATKKAIIRGEAIRLMRRCSEKKYWDDAMLELKLLFRARGYSNEFVNRAIRKVVFILPEERCKVMNPRREGRIFFFKTVFDGRRPPIRPLLMTNWEDFNDDEACSGVFSGAKVMMCFRNDRNLRSLITRSALKQDIRFNDITSIPGRQYRIQRVIGKCGRVGCLTCEVLEDKSCLIATATRERHFITSRMTCTSSHIVYVIRCIICDRQYVGKTTCPLHIRMNHHRDKFKNTVACPGRYLVYRHFDSHGGWASMRVTPFLAGDPADHLGLLQLEKETILALKTYIPFGLNSLFHQGVKLVIV